MTVVENPPETTGTKTYTFKILTDSREVIITCPRSTWGAALKYIEANELPRFQGQNPRLRFIGAS